ncbi:copper chaperone PCu(A)C [Reinekea thalattae]|uniref:Copper chaperone PCu(A)C n=1 Tax=Reinekea thalattae TaxID=2593301 RepID=A0A5C8Z8Y0_9GAMM|nr:copper chaperone PCu(A)C [Reinekea thalattae]TXR53814.1 copper chaperone PCu(A)C [Reinekea thalattae]
MKVMFYGLAIIASCSHFLAQATDHTHSSHTHSSHSSHATHQTESALVISDARAKATIPGVKVSLGYFKISNHSDANIRLVAAETPVAEHVEYHSMEIKNNTMSMRMIKHIDIPAHETVVFGPNSYHLMFVAIQSSFVDGQSFPVTLIADDGSRYEVMMHVQNLDSNSGSHSHSHTHSH